MKDVIILTGGAGFIGRGIANKLANGQTAVVAIDNMHPQIHTSAQRPADLPDSVDLIVADVTDAMFWDDFLATHKPREVIHLAAETGTGQSLTESTRHAHVNIVGTTQMLDAFVRNQSIPTSIILTSSRAVYGEGAWRDSSGGLFYPGLRSHLALAAGEWNIVDVSGAPATPLAHRAQQVFPKPSSIYGATKLAQEQIVSCWCAAMGISSTIFRFQNVYGPGQSPFNPYTGIITLFHRIASAGNAIEIYEDGQVGRDFVYIDDVVDACVAAIEKPSEETRYLDVGTGTATTIQEAAEAIAAIHDAPKPQISGRFRDGDIRWAVADTADLQRELGVRCSTSFLDTGIFKVGEWLKAERII